MTAPALRKPGHLLLGLLLLAPASTALGQFEALTMDWEQEKELSEFKVVRMTLSLTPAAANPDGGIDCQATGATASAVTVFPGHLEVDPQNPGQPWELHVSYDPAKDPSIEPYTLPIRCDDVIHGHTIETPVQVVPGTSGDEAPSIDFHEDRIGLVGEWWPLRVGRFEAASGIQGPDAEVTWKVVEGQATLFNQLTTRFDATGHSGNMIMVLPEQNNEDVLVLTRIVPASGLEDRIDMIHTLQNNGLRVANQTTRLDPKFFSSDGQGSGHLLRVRPDSVGRLRVHLEDNDGKDLDSHIFYWAGNWGATRIEAFKDPDEGEHSITRAEIYFPPNIESWLPIDEPPAILVWSATNVGDDAGELTSKKVAFEVTEDLPSLYGCTQAPGSATTAALWLLGLLGPLLWLARRRRGGGLAALLALLAVSPATAQNAPKKKPGLAFTGVVAPPNANPDEVRAISEYLQTELIGRGRYQVVGPAEIQALMGLEAQKQLLGCDDASSSCLAEVGGALGSDRLLSGNVTRVGNSVILSISLLDVSSARLIHRAGKRVKVDDSLEPLLDVVPLLLDEVIARDKLVALPPALPPVAAATPGGTPTTTPDPAVAPRPPADPAPGPTLAPTPPGPPAAPEAPAIPGPPPLAAAHRGAGTFLLSYHHELALPAPGGVFAIGLRWRRGLIGATVAGLGHPDKDPPYPTRSAGLRLEARVYPYDLGRVAPFVGVGLTALFPTSLFRMVGGAEIALSGFRFSATVALELNLNDTAFFVPTQPLLGLGVGYAF